MFPPPLKAVVFVGPGGTTVSYYGPCISNMFKWNTLQQSSSSNKQGMICPGLSVDRPVAATDLSADYYNNVVSADPLLFSYQGCTCAPPLVAYYHIDSEGRLAHMWMRPIMATQGNICIPNTRLPLLL